MRFGVQLSNYLTNWDDIRGCVEALDGGRWNSVWFSDHFVPPGRGRPETGGRVRGVDRGGGGGGYYPEAADRPPGTRQYVPQPGAAGEDGRHPRPHLAGTHHARAGGGVVRARAPGVRLGVPDHARAAGPVSGGDGADQGTVHRRWTGHLRGRLLPPGQCAVCAALLSAAAPADPGRRHRRAAYPADLGDVRRPDEPRRLDRRGDVARAVPPQGERAGAPLCGRGARTRQRSSVR